MLKKIKKYFHKCTYVPFKVEVVMDSVEYGRRGSEEQYTRQVICPTCGDIKYLPRVDSEITKYKN